MTHPSSNESHILYTIPDGIAINTEGLFVYVNESLANMLGYTTAELLGMRFLDVTSPEYKEIIRKRIGLSWPGPSEEIITYDRTIQWVRS